MSKRRCFISAPYGDDLGVLQRVLDNEDVSWEWETFFPGQLVVTTIIDAIRSADFVIGVLHETRAQSNNLLEIGAALGLGKPLLLLKRGEGGVPSTLAHLECLSTDLQDQKLLSFQVDMFLRSLDKRRTERRPNKPSSSERKRMPSNLPSLQLESALEQSLVDAVVASGGRVTAPSRKRAEYTPDLLIWLPDADAELLNPAVVEVTGLRDVADLVEKRERLSRFLLSSGLQCGIIALHDAKSSTFKLQDIRAIPGIYVVSIDALISMLAQDQLASWLRTERNRLAHGAR